MQPAKGRLHKHFRAAFLLEKFDAFFGELQLANFARHSAIGAQNWQILRPI